LVFSCTAYPDANLASKGIPVPIQNLILDHQHFKWNSAVHKVVAIIAHSIATLEKTNATLADCYFEFLRIAREMHILFETWELEFHEFAVHCIRSYNLRFKVVSSIVSLL
jgi:hypothetical protein